MGNNNEQYNILYKKHRNNLFTLSDCHLRKTNTIPEIFFNNVLKPRKSFAIIYRKFKFRKLNTSGMTEICKNNIQNRSIIKIKS